MSAECFALHRAAEILNPGNKRRKRRTVDLRQRPAKSRRDSGYKLGLHPSKFFTVFLAIFCTRLSTRRSRTAHFIFALFYGVSCTRLFSFPPRVQYLSLMTYTVEAVNTYTGEIILNTGETVHASDYIDAQGELTEEISEASAFIAPLPNGQWLTVFLGEFELPVLH